MSPMQFQFGFHMSFVFAEVTRAYVSCVFGVTEVGLSTAIYGASSLLTSLFAGKMFGRLGRKIPAAVALTLNVGVYLFYILWVPQENSNVVVIYVLLFACGIIDGCMQMVTSVMAKIVFPDTTDQAQAAWTFWCTMGFTVTFAWSTALCVFVKVYIMFGVLLFATVTHGK
ncbi:protein unc-93 homolog A-like [Ciona intestinalis]